MAQFYGTLQGQRGEASRLGGKSSGLRTTAAGWGGAIRVNVWHDEESGEDQFRVELTPWHGSGGNTQVLAQGVLDAHARRLTVDHTERFVVPQEADAHGC